MSIRLLFPRASSVFAIAFAIAALNACGSAPAPAGSLNLVTEVDQCPLVTQVSVLPLEVVIDGKLDVSAQLNFDGGTPYWSATGGDFADDRALKTSFLCGAPGRQMLTLTISDGDRCEDHVNVAVRCSYSTKCGDHHLDLGEQCDDGNLNPFDGCSPHCRFEVQ
jgi:cysteine-rich repeat protein